MRSTCYENESYNIKVEAGWLPFDEYLLLLPPTTLDKPFADLVAKEELLLNARLVAIEAYKFYLQVETLEAFDLSEDANDAAETANDEFYNAYCAYYNIASVLDEDNCTPLQYLPYN